MRKRPGRDPEMPPSLPPLSSEEQVENEALAAEMRRLSEFYRQQNLATAVCLAQMALAGKGPLVAHFCEIGRRYAYLLRAPTQQERRSTFSVIEGGLGRDTAR